RASSVHVSGRGPTSDISPRTTCQSCGSSSTEWRRKNAAKGLAIRGSAGFFESSAGSEAILSIHPRSREFGAFPFHIVLSLSIQNTLPFFPTRRCATNGERRESVETARIEIAIKELAATRQIRAAARSASPAEERPLDFLSRRTIAGSEGARFMADKIEASLRLFVIEYKN